MTLLAAPTNAPPAPHFVPPPANRNFLPVPATTKPRASVPSISTICLPPWLTPQRQPPSPLTPRFRRPPPPQLPARTTLSPSPSRPPPVPAPQLPPAL